ncbi:ParA family protein [Thermoflexus sp.]|uniref:ParA family protein n=1 Tax=Thermoflexus sp. TaxID=1969742 RepID=UPI0025CFBB2D|nr:ParA family protein [Thermoflexus sp.]MDW8065378.1 ParA family protein [Anaerolineae bacterium]MCS6964330.1 ParA family protein [Thermoflexus sp.]MCS7350130.1 ParA family protein [Thermoflexus sp.]MCX7689495.1 ParA family protein [Thermoflexus sp.]MDW8179579.1 ParA family protein [Anaerolineae bacterium]
MARTIAVVSQKGGVGKTTTVVHLGVALAERGVPTLLVDLDPQAALTAAFGLNEDLSLTIEASLMKGIAITQVIRNVRPSLDIIPASFQLNQAELSLHQRPRWPYRLREALQPIQGRYAYILIDAPPGLGPLTVNAIAAADAFLVPIRPDYLSLRSLKGLLIAIGRLRQQLGLSIELLGILPTMVQLHLRHHRDVLAELTAAFGRKVFQVFIPQSIRFAEAPVAGQSLLDYMASHPGAQAYRRLAALIEEAGGG